ncbi:hypothetical protein [Geobacillus sp. BMUD]|nr:hypothetical protein [Geobacillus sp. BMUD]
MSHILRVPVLAKRKTIAAELLRQQPSAVFREVVGMMGERGET